MHPRTKATLDDLAAANWFERVGVADTDAAVVLSSWHEAVESCSSPEWEDLCFEAINQFCERLAERSVEKFNKWNDLVAEFKPITRDMVQAKTWQVVEENNLPKLFLDNVERDVLLLALEAEYADVFPPAFFASQAYWYTKGHFPCGWRGVFPQGLLVIY
ncbi:hypothetical protein ANRL4_00911 [Anaerolineae bacterium]|nr:hypothetical protein ANRL4_00911 [Anaerolineae bacterium]